MSRRALVPVLLAVLAGCAYPGLLTSKRYHDAAAGYADGTPWTVAQIVRRFPELDGILITAPDYLAEQESRVAERAAAGGGGEPAEDDVYRISTGVSMTIELSGESEGTRNFTVGPTGMIDYPFIGEVMVRGRTIGQVREEMQGRLAAYLRNPRILVNLSSLPSLGASQLTAGDITVITQAASTTFNYTGDERISQVLAAVDAVTDRHEWRQVRGIRREGEDGRPRMILVDMWRLLTSADLRQDLPLRAGDLIYVPRHWTLGDQFEQDVDILLKYFKRTIDVDAFVKFLETKI